MTTVQKIRVGFIGLNPDTQWAATAHLPALHALADDFEIVGVANSTPESARRTAESLSLKNAFASADTLIASPEVDVVIVTVKVPHHFELVSAALNAGKHVYCEWPLGNGLDEARKLEALAREKGVVAVIGTQARTAPGVEQMRALVASGYVGRVLSSTLIGSGGNWGDQTDAKSYYLFDEANGATMQSIALGHALSAIRHVLGEFGALDATFVRNFGSVRLSDTGEDRPKSVPDQVLVQGRMADGAAISIHYRGGVSRGTNFLWEVNGTNGDLRATGDMGYPQIVELSLSGACGDERALHPIPPHATEDAHFSSPAARNVAGIYKQMAQDIRTGSRTAPTFTDAVELHVLLDAIEASAAAKL